MPVSDGDVRSWLSMQIRPNSTYHGNPTCPTRPMTKRPISSILLVLVLVGASAFVGHYFGVVAFVSTLPFFAALLARPLMALGSLIRTKMRAHVWAGVHGRHYVFRDVRIQVLEDDDRFRWVCLADVRRALPDIADDRALALTYPERFRTMGKPARAHLRDDALAQHLSKQGNLTAFKFRTWVERAVMMPGEKIRRNLEIQNTSAGASKLG